jgi:hypothetical protein
MQTSCRQSGDNTRRCCRLTTAPVQQRQTSAACSSMSGELCRCALGKTQDTNQPNGRGNNQLPPEPAAGLAIGIDEGDGSPGLQIDYWRSQDSGQRPVLQAVGGVPRLELHEDVRSVTGWSGWDSNPRPSGWTPATSLNALARGERPPPRVRRDPGPPRLTGVRLNRLSTRVHAQ